MRNALWTRRRPDYNKHHLYRDYRRVGGCSSSPAPNRQQHLQLGSLFMAPALIVTIVRHGETEENRLRIVQGQLDTKLSDAGRKQADVVAAALAAPEVPFSHAFSSDLSRSVEVRFSSNWSGPSSDRSDPKTAEAILRYHPHLRLQKQELLRERVTNTRRVSHVKEVLTRRCIVLRICRRETMGGPGARYGTSPRPQSSYAPVVDRHHYAPHPHRP